MAESVWGMILAVQASNLTGWIAIVISIFALTGTLGNFVLALWQRRKHVRIRSSEVTESVEDGPGPSVYLCKVTNTGSIGVQIERVELRSSRGANVGIVLKLAKDEQPKKLDQGESQEWGMYLHDIEERLEG